MFTSLAMSILSDGERDTKLVGATMDEDDAKTTASLLETRSAVRIPAATLAEAAVT
jgi:hypothetical protein